MHVQLSYRNVDHSEKIDRLVDAEAHKLEKFFARATGCRVLVERPHGRRESEYSVRIDIAVPGEELAITHEPADAPHKDLQLAVRDAFRKAARRLQDYARRKRGS